MKRTLAYRDQKQVTVCIRFRTGITKIYYEMATTYKTFYLSNKINAPQQGHIIKQNFYEIK